MNIVQLQYKLRDLPESTVTAAANGQIPDIPEMLATMELNRRARVEKSGAKPPTKSIKEQLEEKLSNQPQEQMGLPAMLQQAQQANGEPQQEQVQQQGQPQMPPQQMAQQGMPQQMPQQPPAQQMRMGGVAGLPSNMFKQFYGGGIVAFAEGDLVEDESAAETARLKRLEEIAAARELLDVTGSNKQEEPQSRSMQAPQAPALPPEVAQANQIIEQTPYNQEAAQALRGLAGKIQQTTPEEKMAEREALYTKFGIRPPGEDEEARIAKSNKAYEEDKAKREGFQAAKVLSAGARPNVYGKYMPGTIGEAYSTFGLANLDADRAFREANEKAEVAAKEAKRAFKLNDLNTAITATQKEKEAIQEANKASATGLAQMASYASNAMGQLLTNAENKRYHDMWEKIEDKKLKATIEHYAQQANANIPEVLRLADGIEKRFPELTKNMTAEQKLSYAADQIARYRGSESKEAALRLKREEDIQKEAKTNPNVLKAKSALAKAKTPEEKKKAREDLQEAMKDVEAMFLPISIGTTGGISTLPKDGKNADSANVTQYDVTGKRVVKPSSAPNP